MRDYANKYGEVTMRNYIRKKSKLIDLKRYGNIFSKLQSKKIEIMMKIMKEK